MSPARGAAQTAQQYLADDSTALLYHLNDTGGSIARDSSGHDRHGALTGLGTGLRSVPGPDGTRGFLESAVEARGGQAGRVTWVDSGSGNHSFLCPNVETGITIEGWFKLEGGHGRRAVLFAVSPVDARSLRQIDYMLQLVPVRGSDPKQEGSLSLVFRDSSGPRAVSEPIGWQAGDWYHIAVTMKSTPDRSTYRLYWTASGSREPHLLVSAEGKPLVLDASRADRLVSFGSRFSPQESEAFVGRIDELRISTVAREPGALKLSVAPTVDDRIRVEALANNSETDHPLPLASTWDTGRQSHRPQYGEGYTPEWQLRSIAKGHHILPALALPEPWTDIEAPEERQRFGAYEAALRECAARRLPVSFPGTQWEIPLASEPKYLNLPARENPNALSTERRRQAVTFIDHWQRLRGLLSPFGALSAWRAMGKLWGSSAVMRALQEWYPNPPKVIFISNNEAPKITWPEATKDQRYLDRIARLPKRPASDDETRKLMGDGWIERYRLLQSSWRKELLASEQPAWGENVLFAAYGAAGMSQMGRWGGWMRYSLTSERRPDPAPLMWDGAMVSGYLSPGHVLPVGKAHFPTDYWVFSPQVGYMNDEYFRREALRVNPDFWLELGVWNGDDEYPPTEAKLASFDPPYTAVRYGGMVQFGMWILRPRVVRDFRGGKGRSYNQPYFDQVLAAVDLVYSHATLRSFWRNSELVPNRAQPHPYAAGLPAEVAAADRMFMLEVDINPPTPWTAFTEVPVFALARAQGEPSDRRWLVYAYAPRAGEDYLTVDVTIPAPLPDSPQHSIVSRIAASSGGCFSLVSEQTQAVWTMSPECSEQVCPAPH